jgi:beta-galactosidase
MPRRDGPWPRGMEGRLCYGGDYNPEQWPESVWVEDIALMREARVNLVSLGVFAWSRLEPREGEYEFGWLDRVMDRLGEAGIGAALATPTASPPPWFSFAHPDALPVTREGVRLTHGSRDTYCMSAPAYRDAAVRIATELGRRYARHPALAMWHVHNEYGTSCFCDHVANAFRSWLQRRYGTLDRLNEAWTTSFWSQWYGEWAHVLPPRATQYLPNPSQVLDFRRFVSDELLDRFREQRDVLHTLAPDVPVTTNLVLAGWVSVDPWSWAREVDFVAVDHYPVDATSPRTEHETAFAADLARGFAGGRPWLLMETAPHHVHVAGYALPKEPGRLARLSMSYVARGSRGAMFFQWRASAGGAEQYHSAMVPHAGPDTRAFREVVALGEVLDRIAEADASTVDAHVAVMWDPDSWWALQKPARPSPELDYVGVVRGVHTALWQIGATADVVSPHADLSPYRLVLVPALYISSDETLAAMRSYVERGGTLAVWYLSGTADAYNRVRPGGYAAGLRDVLGIRVEETYPLGPGAAVTLSTGETAVVWTELVRPDGARVVSKYGSGPLNGQPAITSNLFGQGTAWYISTHLDEYGLERLIRRLMMDAGTEPSASTGIELVRRRSATGSWLFAINHTDADWTVAARGTDLVSGRAVEDLLRLGPGGYAVVREH